MVQSFAQCLGLLSCTKAKLMFKINNLRDEIVMFDYFSKHRVGICIMLATLVCLSFIVVFFNFFPLNLNTPLEQWINSAVYFNNLFSPILLFITMLLLFLTWRDTKKALDIQMNDNEYMLVNQSVTESISKFQTGVFFENSDEFMVRIGDSYSSIYTHFDKTGKISKTGANHVCQLFRLQDRHLSEIYVLVDLITFYVSKVKHNQHLQLIYANIAGSFGVDRFTTIILIIEFKYWKMNKHGANQFDLDKLSENKRVLYQIFNAFSLEPSLTSKAFEDSLLDKYFKDYV